MHGTPGEAVDALAWLTLLALLYRELEASSHPVHGTPPIAVRPARLLTGGAVVAAALAYVRAHAGLDAAGGGLWIAVVMLLERVASGIRSAQRRNEALEIAAGEAVDACRTLAPAAGLELAA